jgi:hypothetical protein
MASGRVRVFLTHGEAKGRKPLVALLRDRYRIKAEMPGMDSEVTI